jgi:hypothetical protein
MLKPNLADPTPEDVRQFVVAVTGLALEDWRAGSKQYGRTGKEIVRMCAREWRILHVKMASEIYNKTIWTMESAGKY